MRTPTILILSAAAALTVPGAAPAGERDAVRTVVGQYCLGCHGGDSPKGSLDLASVADEDVSRHTQMWEKVARRLRAGQMPPAGRKRPDEETYAAVLAQLEI